MNESQAIFFRAQRLNPWDDFCGIAGPEYYAVHIFRLKTHAIWLAAERIGNKTLAPLDFIHEPIHEKSGIGAPRKVQSEFFMGGHWDE